VGKVTSVTAHEKNANLFVTQIDVGEAEPRLAITALGTAYKPEEVKGKSVVAVLNIKPAGTPKVTAVLLCADVKDAKDPSKSSRVLLTADAKTADALKAGTKVAPRGVKVTPVKHFAYKTTPLGLAIDAAGWLVLSVLWFAAAGSHVQTVVFAGKTLYGTIALEADGTAIIADKKVVNTSCST
jgi:tRNA-binding EMAP/Myf-like protein